ncbi:hypothetical protein AA18890_3309 [Komagataeibacter europaeus LMG 18890]|nr:hypothetical protein AA18890_3309 [Komagataeibacter europaeus LMG 18890]
MYQGNKEFFKGKMTHRQGLPVTLHGDPVRRPSYGWENYTVSRRVVGRMALLAAQEKGEWLLRCYIQPLPCRAGGQPELHRVPA